jgi:hypothetical protein
LGLTLGNSSVDDYGFQGGGNSPSGDRGGSGAANSPFSQSFLNKENNAISVFDAGSSSPNLGGSSNKLVLPQSSLKLAAGHGLGGT